MGAIKAILLSISAAALLLFFPAGAFAQVITVSVGTLQSQSQVSPEQAAVFGESLSGFSSAPVGLFAFTITGLTNGESTSVTINLAGLGGEPANATWYWYNSTTGVWTNATPFVIISGNVVTVLATDGGFGDNDVMANGTITDPIGPIVFSSSSGGTSSGGSVTSSGGGSGGGSGCGAIGVDAIAIIGAVYFVRRIVR